VRLLDAESAGVEMCPSGTTLGNLLPKPLQKKDAPPHKVGEELPLLDQYPGGEGVHSDAEESPTTDPYCPEGPAIGSRSKLTRLQRSQMIG
jgi:hypothetical protein